MFNIKSKGFHVGIDFRSLMIQPQAGERPNRGRQIGVYDANQTMVKDEAEIEQENRYEIVYVPKSMI